MLKQQVRMFYQLLWDAHDKSAMPAILHTDFSFRGSLGQQTQGHDGFAAYVDLVHRALGDYRCHISELVEEDNRVFARMSFSGIHRDDLLGFPPTGHRISWHGCALFTFEDKLIRDAWVLGDLYGLQQQLENNQKPES